MTPREKAEEITLVYYNLGKHLYVPISFAKQCALIAIDEIIKSSPTIIGQMTGIKSNKKYWQKVKQELELL